MRYSSNMKVRLLHEIDPETKDDILENGIKRGAEGEKTDSEKQKIDTFLDTHLPDWAKEQQVSRRSATYCYLEADGKIIDITDGEPVDLADFMAKSGQTLLWLDVEVDDCYVSDLDAYDTLMRAMELDEQDSTREHLADRYWQRMIPLGEYQPGMIRRPEVLVVADVDPHDMRVAAEEER